MAGGRGWRLRPYTDTQPKTLLHVGESTLLEQIIGLYASQGLKRFYVSVGYLAHKIESFLGDGRRFGVTVEYLREEDPLGTAGALKFLPPQDNPVLVTNSDVLTRYDVGEFISFHRQSNCEASLCAAAHEYPVPYGVLKARSGKLESVSEKPVSRWRVNAGIYLLNPELLNRIPETGCDMPELLNMADGVGVYDLPGKWQDVGTPEDLERAQREWAA